MNFIITLLKGHIAKFLNGIHSDKCRNSQFIKVIISHRGMLNHKLDTVTYLSQGSGTIMEQRTEDCNNQRLDRTSAK